MNLRFRDEVSGGNIRESHQPFHIAWSHETSGTMEGKKANGDRDGLVSPCLCCPLYSTLRAN